MPRNNGKADLPSRVEWLKVSDLTIGARYQRTIRQAKVDAIAAEFDPFQFGIPAASKRADGSMHVTDGQHRIMALRKMGWDDQMIQVEVIAELPYTEEAGMHVDRNANRTTTSAIDRYYGNLEAARPIQTALEGLLRSRNLQVTLERKDGSITAVGSLERLYEQGGRELVTRVLDTVIACWGTASDGFAAPIVKGLGRLFLEYDRMVNQDKLVRSLSRLRPAEYVKRAYAGRDLNRSNVVANIVVAVVADYNNIPGGSKLPAPTDLVGQGRGGSHAGMRPTIQQRAQIKQLAAKGGLSRRQIKERYPNVSMKAIGNIFSEVGAQKKRRGRKPKGL